MSSFYQLLSINNKSKSILYGSILYCACMYSMGFFFDNTLDKSRGVHFHEIKLRNMESCVKRKYTKQKVHIDA